MRCPSPPAVTVALRYQARQVILMDLLDRHDPNLLDLCDHHTRALTPPLGWTVRDSRAPVPAGTV